jgi:hypothetical protein
VRSCVKNKTKQNRTNKKKQLKYDGNPIRKKERNGIMFLSKQNLFFHRRASGLQILALDAYYGEDQRHRGRTVLMS